MATVAHQMFHAFEDTYNTYKDGKDVEMEMRLGKKNMNGIFDTNIPQAQWTSVKNGLDKYTEWEMTDHQKFTVFRGKRGVRLTEEQDTGERKCIRKITRENKDFPVDTWNVRFGVSVEKPIKEEDQPDEFDDTIEKERWSYVRKNLRIDLTVITPEDMDAEEPIHQIELEMLPPYTEDRDTLFNQMYKVFDVLKLMPSRP